MVLPFPKEKFSLIIQGWLFSMFSVAEILVICVTNMKLAVNSFFFPYFSFGKGKGVGKHGNLIQVLRLTNSGEGMDFPGRQRTSVLQQPPSSADKSHEGESTVYHPLYTNPTSREKLSSIWCRSAANLDCQQNSQLFKGSNYSSFLCSSQTVCTYCSQYWTL